jgi:hypothetical protein
MKAAQIVIGQTYEVLVSGKLVPVRITGTRPSLIHKVNGWRGVNTVTGREIIIKTARRLRRVIESAKPPSGTPGPKSLSDLFRF